MALLFQSNPDQWDLRKHMQPGKYVSWFVNRYQAFMQPGVLVLLWEAKGSGPERVKGLYGWGITTGEIQKDERGKQRIKLQYIERWKSNIDRDKSSIEDFVAPIPAAQMLSLPAWKSHLLNVMPVGTNFLVTPEQLRELSDLVTAQFPRSQFYRAVTQDLNGQKLVLETFTISPDLILEGEE